MKVLNHHFPVQIQLELTPLRRVLRYFLSSLGNVKAIVIVTTTAPRVSTASRETANQRLYPGAVDLTIVGRIIAPGKLLRETRQAFHDPCQYYLFLKKILQIFPIYHSSIAREIVIRILIVLMD
jgi:hypothetical protein